MDAQQKYLDFEIKIEELGDGSYRATVIDMPLAEGQEQVAHIFRLPFGDEELARALAVLGGRANVAASEQARQARAFGEALFRAVFAGPVYAAYFSSLDRAQTSAGLRIKLFLEQAGKMADLPWELLRDPGIDYLALSRTTPLVRHPRRLVIRPRPVFKPPLRVLVMVSSPSDMPPVDVEAEWQNLLAATATLRARGLIRLDRLEDASLRTLQRLLRAGEYHVFHYIGHSTFDPASGQGMLALEDPFGEGSSFPVRGEELARELSEENAIRLVVLNSCQSAVARPDDPFAGIASSVVARGIPAVVAMQRAISERGARVFSEDFYRALADGLPVDAAVSEARRALSHTLGGIEWATPVLFMRAPDGLLFRTAERFNLAVLLGQRRVQIALAGVLAALILLVIGLVAWGGGGEDVVPTPDVDLLIEEVEVIPARPMPGEKAAIIVQVVNNSRDRVGPFSYDFREDVLDPTPSFSGEVGGLAPGDRTTIFIPHSFSWWGAFVSEVRIDVLSKIPETDEFNNTRRSPILTRDGPFVVAFDQLPGGRTVKTSTQLDAAAFAAWGFTLSALPDGAECAGAVPWIVVEGEARTLRAGLPGDPAACPAIGIALVFERGVVGGARVSLEVTQAGTYSLAAFGLDGTELARDEQAFTPGERTLEVTGALLAPLDVARIEVRSREGAPLRVTRLELSEAMGARGR